MSLALCVCVCVIFQRIKPEWKFLPVQLDEWTAGTITNLFNFLKRHQTKLTLTKQNVLLTKIPSQGTVEWDHCLSSTCGFCCLLVVGFFCCCFLTNCLEFRPLGWWLDVRRVTPGTGCNSILSPEIQRLYLMQHHMLCPKIFNNLQQAGEDLLLCLLCFNTVFVHVSHVLVWTKRQNIT